MWKQCWSVIDKLDEKGFLEAAKASLQGLMNHCGTQDEENCKGECHWYKQQCHESCTHMKSKTDCDFPRCEWNEKKNNCQSNHTLPHPPKEENALACPLSLSPKWVVLQMGCVLNGSQRNGLR